MRAAARLLFVAVIAQIAISCAPPGGGQQVSALPAESRRALNLARASVQAREYTTAVNLYKQAVAAARGQLAPYLELADLYLALKQPADAAKVLEQAMMLPSSAEEYYAVGQGWMKAARYEKAAEAFDRAIAKDGNMLKAHTGKGVALDITGLHEEARSAYDAGLAVSPDYPALLNNKAMSYILGGNYGDAREILDKLSRLHPEKALYRQNLALAYGLSGDMERAHALGSRDLTEEEVRENIEFYKDYARRVKPKRPAVPSGAAPQEKPVLPEGFEMAP